MDSQRILRVPRAGATDDFVLVNVSRAGPSELDLKLIATEGEYPYVGSVKSSLLKSLRATTYHGSDEEWTCILAHVLGQSRSSTPASEDCLSGLEVVAALKTSKDEHSTKEIVLTLRKRIDVITQRLGAITLKQDDDQAIQLFDWTGIAVSRADALAEQILSLINKYRTAEDTINQLNSQLEELIQAKNDHDDQLIAKFVQLLNEKKLKIRNQRRLLAMANVDHAKIAGLATGCSDANGRLKRKAEDGNAAMSESEGDFGRMDIDNDKLSNDAANESDKCSTSEPSENETATEEEVGDDPPGSKSVSPLSKATRAPIARQVATRNVTKSAKAGPPSAPPPRRELPFTRRSRDCKPAITENQPQSDPNIPGDRAETGDETDDDEL